MWAYIGSSHNEQIKNSLKNVTPPNFSPRIWKIDIEEDWGGGDESPPVIPAVLLLSECPLVLCMVSCCDFLRYLTAVNES